MMITETVSEKDLKVTCLSEGTSSAAQITTHNTPGTHTSLNDLLTFAKTLTYLTIETEHVNVSLLGSLQLTYPFITIHPSIHTISLIQDKYLQKLNFVSAGIKVGPFQLVDTTDSVSIHTCITTFAHQYSYPLILKSSTFSYDGRGNTTITSSAEIIHASNSQTHPLYIESFINYQSEVSVIVARDQGGEMVCYEPTFTYQQAGVCVYTLTPYHCLEMRQELLDVAMSVVLAVDGVGVFGVEMFVVKKDGEMRDGKGYDVLVNEVACRPHNSGHWTIEGTRNSQFKQHVRCVTGEHVIKDVEMSYECVGMVNLLGGQSKEEFDLTLEKCKSAVKKNSEDGAVSEGVRCVLYMYDKTWRVGRKLGHMNVCGDHVDVERVVKGIAGQ